MTNTVVHADETEKKFLVGNVRKQAPWPKEQIVYQWYTHLEAGAHTKKKLIFDLATQRIRYVEVTKKSESLGTNSKEIKYFNIEDFSSKELIGIPFVLKRRSIKDKLFLDVFLRSNGICKYLLEDESDGGGTAPDGEYEVLQEVTDDIRYYNQAMTTAFTEDDAGKLDYLLSIFHAAE